MRPQDTTHLIQRPRYQRGSLCKDPAGNRTTGRPDHRKETQTAAVWSYFQFIRSSQNHLAKAQCMGEEEKADRGRGEKTTRKLVGNSSMVPQRPSRIRDRGVEVKSRDICVMYLNTVGYPSGLGTRYLDLITAVVYCHWQDLIMDT